jgi:Uma2 family endonuclease
MPSSNAQVEPRDQALTIGDLAEGGYDLPGELVRGQLIPMTPTGQTHAAVELNVAFALKSFLQDKHVGKVMTGEVGIITQRSPDTVRGADVAYISYDRLKDTSADGYLDVAPELIAEIVSPNDRWTDINQKLEEYFAIGVLTVWIVDPEERRVYVYRSPTQVEKLGPAEVIISEDLLPGLRIPVGDLFEH